MTSLRVIRLTDAQLSAIVCSGILDSAAVESGELSADEDILRLSISGTKLVVSPNTRDSIAHAVNELSNSEDEFARTHKGEQPMSFLAERASLALANLLTKISRLTFEEVPS